MVAGPRFCAERPELMSKKPKAGRHVGYSGQRARAGEGAAKADKF